MTPTSTLRWRPCSSAYEPVAVAPICARSHWRPDSGSRPGFGWGFAATRAWGAASTLARSSRPGAPAAGAKPIERSTAAPASAGCRAAAARNSSPAAATVATPTARFSRTIVPPACRIAARAASPDAPRAYSDDELPGRSRTRRRGRRDAGSGREGDRRDGGERAAPDPAHQRPPVGVPAPRRRRIDGVAAGSYAHSADARGGSEACARPTTARSSARPNGLPRCPAAPSVAARRAASAGAAAVMSTTGACGPGAPR